jgi:hypothetical protein
MKNQNTISTLTFYLFTFFSVLSVSSVAKTQLAAAKPLGEDGSIKNNKLCKTNPIYKSREMKLTLCPIMTNSKKL